MRLLVAILVIGVAASTAAQEPRIGIIDFYGIQRTEVEDVRAALTFKEGDTMPEALMAQEQTEKQLLAATSEAERAPLRARLEELEWWAMHVLYNNGTYNMD